MRTSEKIDQLATALIKAMQEMPHITKNKTVSTGKYAYKYADLPQIMEKVIPVLCKNGLALTQTPSESDDGRPILVTMLMHTSGQWQSGSMSLPTGVSPQEMGSFLTYYRRYAITAVLALAAEEDDDGQVAQSKHNEQKTTVLKKPAVAKAMPIVAPKINQPSLGDPFDDIQF